MVKQKTIPIDEKGFKADITSYGNFWLIWLSCASKKDGMSLFNVQNVWGIKTNYLYHKEPGLQKPLFKFMLEEGYLERNGRKLKANFDWIPSYVERKYSSSLFKKNKFKIRDFCEKFQESVFNLDKLKILFKNDARLLKMQGRDFFSFVLLSILFSNLSKLCEKYKAPIVVDMISLLIFCMRSLNLFEYVKMNHSELSNREGFPIIIREKEDLDVIAQEIKLSLTKK